MSDQQPWDSGDASTEHLYAGGGTPLGGTGGGNGTGDGRGRKRRRRGLVIGVVLAVVLLTGGGVWAWQAYFGQGPQPAEALPADTVAYLSVDLDPSGEQKVEALQTLQKFPAFEENVGLETDDDLRREIFDLMQEDGVCPDLDYGADIEPWLGDRAAVAMLEPGAEEPVFVVQVTDRDAATEGMEALVNCGNDQGETSEEVGGYAFLGDWVVLAQSEDVATGAVDAAGDQSLADDEDYDRWTSALGDAGVVNMYAAPEAAEAFTPAVADELGGQDAVPGEETEQMLEEFQGGAGTLRFADGGLQLEVVTGQPDDEIADVLDSDRGADAVSTLPSSTAVAFGAGFGEGWGQVLLDRLTPVIEEESGMSVDEAIAEAEETTGLDLPEDVETMLGESFTLALDSGFDTENLMAGPGPQDVPAGLKVAGDTDEIEAVLEEMRSSMNPEAADALTWAVEGDHVVIGFNEDYLDTIKDEGDLGGTDAFEKVIPEADSSSALLFANFDADDWLTRVVTDAGALEEVVDNVEPLEAAGLSSWSNDDEVHMMLSVSTQD